MSNNRPKRKTKRSTKYDDYVSDSIAGKTNKNSSDNGGAISGENVSGNGNVQETMGNVNVVNGGSDCVSGQAENTVSKNGMEEQAKSNDILESNGVSKVDVVGTNECDMKKNEGVQQNRSEQDKETFVNKNNEGLNEVGTSAKKTYADVTAKNGSNNEAKLVTVPTELDSNGIEVVVFDEILIAEGSKRWDKTLCGYFVGKGMTDNELRYNLRRMWNRYGFKDIVNTSNGIFFMKFHNNEGLDYIVNNGPWMVSKKPFYVQKWDINMSMDKNEPEEVPLWVRICNVPLEAWSVKGISALASRIGKPIIMDSVTAAMCKMGTGRVGFARVLVEVSAKKVLPEFIEVVYKNGVNDVVCRKSIKVEYDWVPPRCSVCYVYGHTDQQCSKKKECDKPECSTKSNRPEEIKGNSSNKGGDDEGFIGVGNNKNGGVEDKVRKQNFKLNTQLPKQVNPKQVPNKPKTTNQFVYQQKKPISQNMQGGSSSGGEEKGKKDSIPSLLKSSPKKAWSVPGEIVDAMKKSANKYSVLGMYDVNELGELTEIRNKEIVDEFISQKKKLTENELQEWNFDMIAYYKQTIKQMENNGKMESSGCGNEVNDVYEDDSGVAQCMEGDVLKGLDGGILHG